MQARLTAGCASSGRKLIAALIDEAKTATDADLSLVTKKLQNYTTRGYVGELKLKPFNSWYKELRNLRRDVPAASRGPDSAVVEMLNSVMIANEDTRTEWNLLLRIARPASLDAQVSAIRDLLRQREVYSEMDSVGKEQLNLGLTAPQLKALAAAGLDSAAAQAALAADPRKSAPRQPQKQPKREVSGIPRDASGKLLYWVPDLGPCDLCKDKNPRDGGEHLRRNCPHSPMPKPGESTRFNKANVADLHYKTPRLVTSS